MVSNKLSFALATGYFDGIFREPAYSSCKPSWMDVLLLSLMITVKGVCVRVCVCNSIHNKKGFYIYC